MKASEIILNSHIFENSTRGEALEKLADLVFEHYGEDNDSDNLSNGPAIDCILRLFDRLITDDHDAEMGLIASIEKMEEDWRDE